MVGIPNRSDHGFMYGNPRTATMVTTDGAMLTGKAEAIDLAVVEVLSNCSPKKLDKEVIFPAVPTAIRANAV